MTRRPLLLFWLAFVPALAVSPVRALAQMRPADLPAQ